MALLVGFTLLVMCLMPCRAEFTLDFQPDVTGTWRRPVVLPCSYVPHTLAQHTVVWLYDGKRIFQRDNEGDHSLTTKYRGRISLPQDQPGGNVSLTIMELQTDDKGAYTCQVSLIPDGAIGRITKAAEIHLTVEKVSVTKPVIQPGASFLELPEQATVNLTCSAYGSLPITYMWYKYALGTGVKVLQSQGASFVIGKVNPSHSGIYFCEAENRIPERKVQQSKELRLSVTAHGFRQTLTSTSIPKRIITTTEIHGKIGKAQTTDTSTTTARKTTGIHKPPTNSADNIPRPAQHTPRIPRVTGVPTKSPGKEASLQTTTDSSKAAVVTATYTADLHSSSGTTSWLIILVILLSLALVCTLIAVLVRRSKKRKGTDGIYEIPIMSQLDARSNQDPPEATIYRVTTCQANGSQANVAWTNDTPLSRKQNQYEPTVAGEAEPHSEAGEAEPHSDYQNALFIHESEYETLLAEKENVQQL